MIIGVDGCHGDTLIINGKEYSVKQRVGEAVSIVREKNPEIELLVNYRDSSLEDLARAVRSKQIGGFFTIGDTTKVCKKAVRVGRSEARKETAPPDLVAITATVIKGKDCLLSDAGAASDINDYDLYCQGLMTSAYAKHFLDIEKPKLGLLCNGTEDHKGNELVKGADVRFKTAIKEKGLSELLDYKGKVETRPGIFGELDIVLAAGGFVGNIYLKLCEDLIKAAFEVSRQEFRDLRGFLNRLSAYAGKRAIREVAKRIKERFNPEKYNGAILLGYNGIVVKGHGASTVEGIYGGILRTRDFVEKDVGSKIKEALDKYS